jgi:16S rRNA (guanine527-N7)-methyltransferase
LGRLFEAAHHLATPSTTWILPKGRSATSELEAAAITWQGSFRIEPSITDPDGAIIVATGVEPRRRR